MVWLSQCNLTYDDFQRAWLISLPSIDLTLAISRRDLETLLYGRKEGSYYSTPSSQSKKESP